MAGSLNMHRAVRWELVPSEWHPFVQTFLPMVVAKDPLDGLDVFAGQKGFAKSLARHGLKGMTFEKEDDPEWNNILNLKGTSTLFFLILRVRTNGIVLLGPPCKFWIFLTLSHTKRTAQNPAGSSSSWMAREGNAIADIVAKFVLRCAALDIFAAIEQPQGSFMFQYGPMKSALEQVGAVTTSFPMVACKHPFNKANKVVGDRAMA